MKQMNELDIKLRQYCSGRISSLYLERYSFWTHWEEIARYLIPRRYKWLITPNQANRGSPINQSILDNTATIALRVLAAGMMSGITSPARPWFKLAVAGLEATDDEDVKVWLAECEKILMAIFQGSNFYTSINTVYEDLGSFGTAAMIIYEDFDDVIRCYNSCAGEYFLAQDARLQVNTLARQFVMTVAQLVGRFGLENCSASVQGLYKGPQARLEQEVIVGHIIEPNDNRVVQAGVGNAPYREVYWEWGSGSDTAVLSKRPFFEFPGVCPRWSIVSNDSYGRSPGMDALGDMKQLQVEQKRKAQAIDKMVNPPLKGHISMKNQPASALPGAITYVQDMTTAGFAPVYTVMPPIAELKEDIKDTQQRIQRTFFYDLFLMISSLDDVRTATEVVERKEEKLIQLGPVLERFENEALTPAVKRTFNIAQRAQLLPPAPPSLQGRKIDIEYVSILAAAQRSVATTAVERLTGTVGNWAAARPEVLDNINFDEATDMYADMLGVPPQIIRSTDEVAEIRSERAKAQQQQAVVEQSMAAVQGANILSQTNVGGGQNALEKMTQGGI